MVLSPRKRLEYEKARFLRTRFGLSYNEIKERLIISKSTLSLWLKDIKLNLKQKKRLQDKTDLMFSQKLGAKANKEKRAKEVEQIKNLAKKEIVNLDHETFKMAGAILYWAEGGKSNGTSFSNSDSRMIEFIVGWLKKTFDISPSRLKAHLHIHYGNDEKKIKKYWSKLTGIPLQNFYKTFIKPKGTGHRTNILPHGIIKIRVSGPKVSDLMHRILAWSEKIYELSKI